MVAQGEGAGEHPHGDRRPTVFVSYCHESERHTDQVRRFAECLVESGADVWLDQWAEGSRRDWSLFAEEMRKADFVVVVASPEYRRVAEGGVVAEHGRGAQYEASLLRELLTADRNLWLPKILPVVLPGRDVDEIPLFLQPRSATHYKIPEITGDGVAALMAAMTGRPPGSGHGPGRKLPTSTAPVRSGIPHRVRVAPVEEAVEEAVKELAAAVAWQWKEEEERRDLLERRLDVRWEVTPDAEAAMAGVRWESVGVVQPGSLSGHIDKVAEFFGRVPSRRLVILGKRGAGKTAVAIRLVRELLAKRAADDPVPVLLSAGSWDPLRHRLPDWMAEQLCRDHSLLRKKISFGTGGKKTLATILVETGRIVPVLDGIDEIGEASGGEAIAAINRLGPDLPLVVTGSTTAYRRAVEHLGRGLARAAVVELRPLEVGEIEHYLADLTGVTPADDTEIPAGRWHRVIKCLRDDPEGVSEPLSQALRTPLMAWLIRTIYERPPADPGELCDRTRFPDAAAIEDHLLDGLLPAVYPAHPPFGKPAYEDARRYLTFLARQMTKDGSTDLAWWQMPRYSAGTARTLNVLFGFAMGAGLGGTLTGPVGGMAFGLFFGLLLANRRVSALLGLREADFERPFTPWVTPRRVGRQVVRLLRFVVLVVVGLGSILLAAAVVIALYPEWETPVLIVMLGAIAVFGLAGVLRSPSQRAGTDDELVVPADVTRAASPVSLLRADGSAVLVGAVYMLALTPLHLLPIFHPFPFTLLLPVGWLMARASGRFRFVCAVLALRGRLPWRTMTFLRDAHHRGVLRQAGAVYQFRHARLQERLANAPKAP